MVQIQYDFALRGRQIMPRKLPAVQIEQNECGARKCVFQLVFYPENTVARVGYNTQPVDSSCPICLFFP